MTRVLIVDDDRVFAAATAQLARDEGCDVQVAHTLGDARQFASRGRIDLLALDLDLPDGNGLELIDHLDLARHGRVVVVTGNPTLDTAMRAVAQPVVDYLVKPMPPDRWIALLREVKAESSATQRSDSGLLGLSEPMRAVTSMLNRIAPTDASVLLTGETGTGKELAARMLHDASDRKGDFVAVNCGAVPHELLASQLFGHERGSFTGAHARQLGMFERAIHGTLFLDEITEMPLTLQVYLLRALETGTITRVGGSDAISTPVRVVAATNRDPFAAVAEGTLREDLYYRLADVVIRMPSLRERGEDISLLASAFVQRLNERYRQGKRLAPNSFRSLRLHAWPGNVRELRSAVQRAYLLGTGDQVEVSLPAPRAQPMQETETTVVFTVGMTLAEIERRMLLKTLAHYDNDKTATARALGVSVRTVHNQLGRIADEGARKERDAA